MTRLVLLQSGNSLSRNCGQKSSLIFLHKVMLIVATWSLLTFKLILTTENILDWLPVIKWHVNIKLTLKYNRSSLTSLLVTFVVFYEPHLLHAIQVKRPLLHTVNEPCYQQTTEFSASAPITLMQQIHAAVPVCQHNCYVHMTCWTLWADQQSLHQYHVPRAVSAACHTGSTSHITNIMHSTTTIVLQSVAENVYCIFTFVDWFSNRL